MNKSQESNFSPEVDLLLCCARTSMDSEACLRVNRLVQEDLNWPLLFKIASRNGVQALLFRNLNTICPGAIPSPFATRLPKFFQVHTLRNKFLAQELIALLHHFDNEEIPAIPFKGPALASMAYGDLSLREFVDLDILVQKQHLPKAYGVLSSMGGIGSALVRTALSWFKENHVRRIELGIWMGNGQGQAFWERQGFLPVRLKMSRDLNNQPNYP